MPKCYIFIQAEQDKLYIIKNVVRQTKGKRRKKSITVTLNCYYIARERCTGFLLCFPWNYFTRLLLFGFRF